LGWLCLRGDANAGASMNAEAAATASVIDAANENTFLAPILILNLSVYF